MIGNDQGVGLGVQGGVRGAISAQTAGTAAAGRMQAQADAMSNGSLGSAPYFFIALAVLYVIWAVVLQHERVRESLSPSNIAINLHNVMAITIGAVLGIVGGKILLTKATAWGIPGAAQLGQLFMAA